MKFLRLLGCTMLLFVCNVKAQKIDDIQLKTGDLLFQDLDCGGLCDAIEGVTEGFDGHDFSHIGLVYLKADTIYIIEAMGKHVKLTPLDDFLKRSKSKVYIGRLQKKYQKLIPKAISYSVSALGTPYDDEFLYNNGKYYCSELIYDAFKDANGNKPFFKLEPMTFKEPGKQTYNPVWIKYYADLEVEIPEAKEGINPGGISKSDKILMLNK